MLKLVRKEEVIKGIAGRVDVLAFGPEDLLLAVSQVEQQLARISVKELGRRNKNPIEVFLIMSEHIISRINY